jgi:hypothetical protein
MSLRQRTPHFFRCPGLIIPRHSSLSLDGLFHGESQTKMDDEQGYPHLWKVRNLNNGGTWGSMSLMTAQPWTCRDSLVTPWFIVFGCLAGPAFSRHFRNSWASNFGINQGFESEFGEAFRKMGRCWQKVMPLNPVRHRWGWRWRRWADRQLWSGSETRSMGAKPHHCTCSWGYF